MNDLLASALHDAIVGCRSHRRCDPRSGDTVHALAASRLRAHPKRRAIFASGLTVEDVAGAIHTSVQHPNFEGCLDMDRDAAVALLAALRGDG